MTDRSLLELRPDHQSFESFFIEGYQRIEIASASVYALVRGDERQHYQSAEEYAVAAEDMHEGKHQESDELHGVTELLAGLGEISDGDESSI